MRGTFFSLQYNSLTIFVLLTCHHHYEFGCEAQQGSKANSKASKEKQVDTSHGGLYASGDKLLYLFQYDFKLCQGVRDVLQYSLVLQVKNILELSFWRRINMFSGYFCGVIF